MKMNWYGENETTVSSATIATATMVTRARKLFTSVKYGLAGLSNMFSVAGALGFL